MNNFSQRGSGSNLRPTEVPFHQRLESPWRLANRVGGSDQLPRPANLRPMYPVGRPHSVQSGGLRKPGKESTLVMGPSAGCSMPTERHGVICRFQFVPPRVTETGKLRPGMDGGACPLSPPTIAQFAGDFYSGSESRISCSSIFMFLLPGLFWMVMCHGPPSRLTPLAS